MDSSSAEIPLTRKEDLRQGERRRALTIANGRFHHPGLRDLPLVTKDAELARNVLEAERLGGFTSVEVLADVDSSQAKAAIYDFFAAAKRSDFLFFHYSGHGLRNIDGELLLSAADTDLERLPISTLSSTFLTECIENCRASWVVVVVDCAFAGVLLNHLRGHGSAELIVICSASAYEYAFEGLEPGSAGFSQTLFTGIETGAADLNGDGWISVHEAFDYTAERMRDRGQAPRMNATVSQDLWLAKAPEGDGDYAAAPALNGERRRTETEPAEPPEPTEPAHESVQSRPPETSADDSDVDWTDDAPATVDLLRRKELAAVLARRLRTLLGNARRTSFLVHVDGPWGTGKSTLLNFLADELTNDFLIVRFDAWQQTRTAPPWWALLTTARQEITHQIRWWRARRLRLGETFSRIRRTGAPYVLAVLILVAITGGIVYGLWPGKSTMETWTAVAKSATAILGAIATLWAGSLVAGRFLLWDSARGARLFEKSDTNPMREITAHFGWLIDHSPKPVMFFIDDLDRCPESYVVEFLDSVQTLVRDTGTRRAKRGRQKKTAYFVVAADGGWLRSSYEATYKAFGGQVSRPGRPLGYLFLDKLFQLTVPLPAPAGPAHARLFDHLLRINTASEERPEEQEINAATERIEQGRGDERKIISAIEEASPAVREIVSGEAALALATPEAQERTEHRLRRFAPLLDGNPRTTKRFLNTYVTLRCVTLLEGHLPSMETLALWAIIRVRWPAIADHLQAQPTAVRGIAEPLWCADHFPEHLREAAVEADLRSVVRCPDGGPLTPDLIRQCCGGTTA